jgi:hypothetical protein
VAAAGRVAVTADNKPPFGADAHAAMCRQIAEAATTVIVTAPASQREDWSPPRPADSTIRRIRPTREPPVAAAARPVPELLSCSIWANARA